ncbi:MAG: glycosyltransferase family 4 protein [Candidatus Coatesbacteria bacterium]|nr:glycosyltransferase family 4 protein [Candidatus Coatesbacteria bacterium]
MAKIAIIDLLFNWPPDGGARTDIHHVASGLSRDHQVVLFCPDFRLGFPRGNIREAPGVAVRKVPFRDSEFQVFTLPRRFRAAIDEFNPDYVFIGDGWHFKPYVVAAMEGYKRILRFYAYESLCPKSHGHFIDNTMRPCNRNWLSGWKDFLPCVLCSHRWLFEHPKNPHFKASFTRALGFLPHYPHLVRRAISSVDTIVCYNEYIANKLRPMNSNIRITPSGIDASNFSPSTAGTSSREHGLRPTRLLMSGRKGDPLKGFEVLLKALAPLVQDGMSIELFVTDAPARTEGFVKFTGWLDQKRLGELYRDVDICVVPSVWPEPFGIVALEAMASEKPVVVTRVGGLQHIIDDGVDGFVVEPFDSAALRDRLKRLIENPALCRSMGKAGRAKVLEKYQWSTIIEQYYEPIFAG